jgi:dTMP kinase
MFFATILFSIVILLASMSESFQEKSNMRRGVFILFEGVDRCGKSTQAITLTNYLSQRGSAELLKFPDRTSIIGQLINAYLSSTTDMSDETIHLLFSANRWEAASSIENKLLSGCNLVKFSYF